MLVNGEEEQPETNEMTAEKLTEFRFLFENNKEQIPNVNINDDC